MNITIVNYSGRIFCRRAYKRDVDVWLICWLWRQRHIW